MLIVSAICIAIGLLLSINGTYQYIFMSTDKISAETIRYGNTFMYVDMAFYAILGFLIVVRSAVQGVFLAGYVLCAGVAELVSRILICAFLPQIVNGGAIDSSASTAAFAAVCFGDPGAWVFAVAVLLYPYIKHIIKKDYRYAFGDNAKAQEYAIERTTDLQNTNDAQDTNDVLDTTDLQDVHSSDGKAN